MRTAWLSRQVIVEIRTLWPAWLASLFVMIASAMVNVEPFRGLGIAAYPLGIAALGALSVGHEYGHRTLTLLLSQPERRERLFLVKLGVLGAMLLTIGAVAGPSVFPRMRGEPGVGLAFVLLPLVGLCVAPWLTMVFRSAIAGAAFTLAMPGTLMTVSQLLYLGIYRRVASVDFTMAVLLRGTIGMCVVGAVMSWRTFMRLEAIDGPGPGLSLPQWLRRPAVASVAAPVFTKRHPIWLLVGKELRLQRVALVVALLNVAGWLTSVTLMAIVPRSIDVYYVLTFFYSLMTSLLVGSLASAEERQLGTHEWQLLLPIASSKQWAVKVGVVLSLALLLAFGLPVLLTSINPGLDGFRWQTLAVAVILLTSGSLYVSSVSASGLWAMLVSLSVVFGVVWFAIFLRFQLSVVSGRGFNADLIRLDSALDLTLVAIFLALLLRFALVNHRSAERAVRRIWTQGLWLACYLTAEVVVTGLIAR